MRRIAINALQLLFLAGIAGTLTETRLHRSATPLPAPHAQAPKEEPWGAGDFYNEDFGCGPEVGVGWPRRSQTIYRDPTPRGAPRWWWYYRLERVDQGSAESPRGRWQLSAGGQGLAAVGHNVIGWDTDGIRFYRAPEDDTGTRRLIVGLRADLPVKTILRCLEDRLGAVDVVMKT